jgi:hypothetical protein
MKLDLTRYDVMIPGVNGDKDVTVDIKQELSDILRAPGVFQNGTQMVDAICIAREISKAVGSIELSDKDLGILQEACNHFIAMEHDPAKGKIALGGVKYSELIMRVFAE